MVSSRIRYDVPRWPVVDDGPYNMFSDPDSESVQLMNFESMTNLHYVGSKHKNVYVMYEYYRQKDKNWAGISAGLERC